MSKRKFNCTIDKIGLSSLSPNKNVNSSSILINYSPNRSDDSMFQDLIHQKAVSTSLILSLKSTEIDNKRSKIEHDLEISTLMTEHRSLKEEHADLKVALLRSQDELKLLTTELELGQSQIRQNNESASHSFITGVIDHQKQLDELQKKLDETESTLQKSKSEMFDLQLQRNTLQNELTDTKTALEMKSKLLNEFREFMDTKKGEMANSVNLQLEIEELKRDLKSSELDREYVSSLKRKLHMQPELEKQNKRFKEENDRLRTIHENIFLLQEENRDLRHKMGIEEAMLCQISALQVEADELRQTLKRWTCQVPSPEQVFPRLARLQQENSILEAGYGQLRRELAETQRALEQKTCLLTQESDQLREKKVCISDLTNEVQNLVWRLRHSEKERDDLDRILHSYGSTNPLSTRISDLEKALEAQRDIVRQRDLDVQRLIGRLAASETISEPPCIKKCENSIESVEESIVATLRFQIVELEEQLQRELLRYQILATRPPTASIAVQAAEIEEATQIAASVVADLFGYDCSPVKYEGNTIEDVLYYSLTNQLSNNSPHLIFKISGKGIPPELISDLSLLSEKDERFLVKEGFYSVPAFLSSLVMSVATEHLTKQLAVESVDFVDNTKEDADKLDLPVLHTKKTEIEEEKVDKHEMDSEDVDLDQENPEDVDLEQENSEDVDLEQENSEDVDLDQENPEGVDLDQENSEDVDLEQENSEDVDLDQENSEDVDLEQKNSEDIDLEQENSEDVDLDQENSEDVDLDQENSEDVDLDQENPKDVNLDQENPEDVNLDQENPEDVDLDQENPEDADISPKDEGDIHLDDSEDIELIEAADKSENIQSSISDDENDDSIFSSDVESTQTSDDVIISNPISIDVISSSGSEDSH